jgi:hypothetical protein
MSLLSDVSNNVQFPGSLKLLLADHESRIETIARAVGAPPPELQDIVSNFDAAVVGLGQLIAALSARVAALEAGAVPKEAPKGK